MLRAIPPLLFFLAATLFLNFSDSAQDRLLTLDDLYDPERRVNTESGSERGLTSKSVRYRSRYCFGKPRNI